MRLPERACHAEKPACGGKKTPPVVIAIRREGRAYPIVVTDFNKASLQAVLDIEPDGRPGAYRLVVGADDKPMSSSEVKYIRFEAAKNAQGKFDRLRIAEPDFMKGKWADYVPLAGRIEPQLNRWSLPDNTGTRKGRTWIFSESGEATWPEQKFNYELSLNDPGRQLRLFAKRKYGQGQCQRKKCRSDAWRRQDTLWLRLEGRQTVDLPARLAGKKVVCDAKPLAVLTPQ